MPTDDIPSLDMPRSVGAGSRPRAHWRTIDKLLDAALTTETICALHYRCLHVGDVPAAQPAVEAGSLLGWLSAPA
jgi:hypothetical protein